jgi:hypothetical protein
MKQPRKPIPIYFFDEHNEAFYYWQKAKHEGHILEPLDLFHIDAHDDMLVPEIFQDSLYPGVAPHNGYLEYWLNFTKNELEIENFIIPAILNGLVKNVYFISPKWRKYKSKRKKYNVASLFGEGKILKHCLKIDKNTDAALFKAFPDLIYYHYIRLDMYQIPKNKNVILDIDLDFFACRDSNFNNMTYKLEITSEQFQRRELFLQDQTLRFAGLDFHFMQQDGKFYAQVGPKKGKEKSHLPSKPEIESEINALITQLQVKKTRPAVVTISRSCISGFCPQEYVEFIETGLKEGLAGLFHC